MRLKVCVAKKTKMFVVCNNFSGLSDSFIDPSGFHRRQTYHNEKQIRRPTTVATIIDSLVFLR